MKKIYLLISISLIAIRVSAGIYDMQLFVIPQYPAISDNIQIVTLTTTNNTSTSLGSSYYLSQDTLYINTCVNEGFGATITTCYDTVHVGSLAVGNYYIHFVAKSTIDSNCDSFNDSDTLISSFQVSDTPVSNNIIRINAINVIPPNPTTAELVKIATTTTTNYAGVPYANSYSLSQDTVYINRCYHITSEPLNTSYFDTLSIGSLLAGNYYLAYEARASYMDNNLYCDAYLGADTFYSSFQVTDDTAQSDQIDAQQIQILPQSPAATDNIEIAITTATNYSSTTLGYSYSVSQDTVYIDGCFAASMDTIIQTHHDTVQIGILTAGNYHVLYHAKVSSDTCATFYNDDILLFDFHVEEATGVDDKIFNKEIYIYPNPATRKININYNVVTIKQIILTDAIGRQIKKYTNNFKTLDIATVASGIYWLNITTDRGNIIKKIIVE